jgi:hypothetical protein
MTHGDLTFTASWHRGERGARGPWHEPLEPDVPAWVEVDDVCRAGVPLDYDEDLWRELATVAVETMR